MKDKCLICKFEKMDVSSRKLLYYSINFERKCVCELCSDLITLQNIKINLDNKWEKINENKKVKIYE